MVDGIFRLGPGPEFTIRAGAGLSETTREAMPTPAGVAERFGAALSKALEGVDGLQRQADRAAERFAVGENRDVAALMIATERAGLALQMTLQIRNKVLEAYQEIIRMPL